MKTIIIGGVAGGATTAARLRRRDEKAEIILFERGEYISYANCGLPYYLGGTIPERDRLFVQTPETFKETLKVDVRIKSEVLSINRQRKTVTVRNSESNQDYEESYDKLVLSPGAAPLKPPIPGIDSSRIFTVRSVPDIDKLKEFTDSRPLKRAVVVGGGFIGLEVAENLHDRGIFVTLVEMADQVMMPLDFDMAAQLHQHMKDKGLELYLSDGVQGFEEREGGQLLITLSSGTKLTADMAVLSIGVKPETQLASEAGLTIGESRGIWVDEFMQTSDPDIYALGDAVELTHPVTGRRGMVPLAGPANKQGRIVADNLVDGNKSRYPGAIGTAAAKVFDLTAGSTGVSEKILLKEGIPYQSVVIHGNSHAGYYPGAMPLFLKLLYSPGDGRILGGQGVGYAGVDKRIDLIAAVIRQGGTYSDLMEMEHAYAPPYSSAKDPVNILGFAAENIEQGRSRQITWRDLKRGLQESPEEFFLLDVRLRDEYAIHTLNGAVNIPLPEVRERLNEIPRDKRVVILCNVGLRSYLMERVLRQEGYERVAILSGGLKLYEPAAGEQSNRGIYDPKGEQPGQIGDSTGHAGGESSHHSNAPQKASSGNGAPGGKGALPLAATAEIKQISVDASGLQCPGPIMKLRQSMEDLRGGDRLTETATDPGFARDVKSWCSMTGNRLISLDDEGGKITAVIEKSAPGEGPASETAASDTSPAAGNPGKEASLVVFSDDMDRALASFVIANGAAAAGKKVTMFFTFWGLNVIKKPKAPRVKKDFMGRMFSLMLPKHAGKLGLSKMNMAGMGASMMRGRMKKLRIDSLESMITSAREAGVEMVACQMSMDVMGVKKEEFIEGVTIGGVASYLEAAGTARTNLFI